MKYLGNRGTDLRKIHMEDVFGLSLGRVWMSRSKVKVTSDKNEKVQHFFRTSPQGRGPRGPCMRCMFGKTSLALVIIVINWQRFHTHLYKEHAECGTLCGTKVMCDSELVTDVSDEFNTVKSDSRRVHF